MRAMLLLLLSVCGCTHVDDGQRGTREENYITGSNLPRRVPPTRGEITTISGSEAQEMLRKGAVPLPQGAGR